MAERKIVERGEAYNESNVKNKWRWEWTEATYGDEKVAKHIRKLSKAGHALCVVCDSELNYGSRGRVVFEKHILSAQHKTTTQSIKGSSTITGNPLPESSGMYGVHPIFAKAPVPREEKRTTPLVPLGDRTQNAEAMLISFVAENNLSLAIVPKLVELTRALAADKKALDNVSSSNTTASYKLKYGVADTFREQLIEELKTTPFSLNIDEAMNSNNTKVVTVLVSHFSENQQAVVINHLSSFSITRVTSENLFDELDRLFVKLELPWNNLLSVMMDSCKVMRGAKSGLETLLRERKAPHLLDVDGDTCHHAHNAAKAFCAPMGHHVEGLVNDLHTDHKWSTHNRDLFQKICLALQIKPSTPMKFVPHRWLSLIEVVADLLRLMDALVVFYYSFLPASDQKLYSCTLKEALHARGVCQKAREEIKNIQKDARDTLKSATKEGKQRKERIVEKLFVQKEKTLMHAHFYTNVLEILHKYIKFFQSKEPKMHRLHDKQEELVKEYLACFVKLDKLDTGVKALKKLNLDDEANIRPPNLMSVGQYANDLQKERHKGDRLVVDFREQAKKAYIAGGKKLLEKMPLHNSVLRCFSCIDPIMKCSVDDSGNSKDTVYTCLLKLFELLNVQFPSMEKCSYEKELQRYILDKNIRPIAENQRIDNWWAELCGDKYPLLKKVVKATLSCFHGPIVESTFSVMGDVIDKATTNMDMETYSAIQDVKTALAARNKSAVEYFRKEDPLKDPVDKTLVKNMQAAAQKDKERREVNKEKKANEAKSLGLEPQKLTTKRKATDDILEEAKRARITECLDLSLVEEQTVESNSKKPDGESEDIIMTGSGKKQQKTLTSFFSRK